MCTSFVEAMTARQHFQFVAFLVRDTTDFAYLFFLLLLLFFYFCPLSIPASFGGTSVGRFGTPCIFIPRPLQVCVRNACERVRVHIQVALKQGASTGEQKDRKYL
jgi:hypothetical protein